MTRSNTVLLVKQITFLLVNQNSKTMNTINCKYIHFYIDCFAIYCTVHNGIHLLTLCNLKDSGPRSGSQLSTTISISVTMTLLLCHSAKQILSQTDWIPSVCPECTYNTELYSAGHSNHIIPCITIYLVFRAYIHPDSISDSVDIVSELQQQEVFDEGGQV